MFKKTKTRLLNEIKKDLVENTEKVNTPLSLFKKIDKAFIDPPKQFIEPEIVDDMDIIAEDLELAKEDIREEIDVNNKVYEIKTLEDKLNLLLDKANSGNDSHGVKSHIGAKLEQTIKKRIQLFCGEDGNLLIERLREMAFYSYDPQVDGVRPRWSEETVRFAVKMLIDNGYDKPKEVKEVNISVEHKIDDYLKRIHQNRLKLLGHDDAN